MPTYKGTFNAADKNRASPRKSATKSSRTPRLPHKEDPPAERFEIPCATIRTRRPGLRSDPAWAQKTLYLKRANAAAGEEVARAMGVDFSVLVDFALALQVAPETRSDRIQGMIQQLKN